MSGLMFLFSGFVIVLAVWAVRSFARRPQVGDSAIDALRMRLASGEITYEEFERTRKALGG